jgi:zinc D-Ala-D-Ala carboxypeptidase
MGTLISKHVEMESLLAYNRAKHGPVHNVPNEWERANLVALAVNVLDPIIDRFGPIAFGSGYRCELLNLKVGGVHDSRHRTGEACDLEPVNPDVTNLDVARWVRDTLLGHVDEVILEFYIDGQPRSGWVHVASRRPPKVNAHEVWTMSKVVGEHGKAKIVTKLGLPI